ncbi:MAG TPA: ATP-binding cassette domain-containing protein, partial [Solirubrobacterales bacterium]|nr:ATP-binding cassette domain-containing protein [Solirubrobacterales bacterium]
MTSSSRSSTATPSWTDGSGEGGGPRSRHASAGSRCGLARSRFTHARSAWGVNSPETQPDPTAARPLESPPLPDSVISIRGLRKSYGDFEAVRGIDLEVVRGEVFAFLGPNGAGKTTTVETLEGYR